MEFIFKESQNIIENNCINRFSQNTSFKKMISKSLLMNNNCLPKSVYGLNFINDDNYKMKIHFTGLDYDNGIENNVFNYYKTEQCKEYKPILTSGSFISNSRVSIGGLLVGALGVNLSLSSSNRSFPSF